jgi:hypothetical protein
MKMKVAIQIENTISLDKVVKSKCNTIRFGSEFCEWKLPSLNSVKKAYHNVTDHQKQFVYITPRVSNTALEMIREQLAFLDKEEKTIDIVVNDLGTFHLVNKYQHLQPCLGRQLVYMPARSPWKQVTRIASSSSTRKHVERVFYQTSLNYPLTSQFFQQRGVNTIDVDWIPPCAPYFNPLIARGFNLAVHLYWVPITITRKCHTARYLDEKTPEKCAKHCNTKMFLLKQTALGMELYLHGNVVYRAEKPSGRAFTRLTKRSEVEFVISMIPVQHLDSTEQINDVMQQLQPDRFGFWSRI